MRTKAEKAAIEKAVEKLDLLDTADAEIAHGEADEILLGLLGDLGAHDVAEAYDRVAESVPFWAFS